MTAAMHDSVEELESAEESASLEESESVVDLTDSKSEPAVMVIDADRLAQTAAEVSAMVDRHKQELAAAMAELTALQRVLRSEVRQVVAELDRIASGVSASTANEGTTHAPTSGAPGLGNTPVEPEAPATRSRGLSRFRRQG
jgi:hypothetical protein